MSRYSWLSVSYNVPIQPSKNRVYIWRKLKEMGAEYLKHGVAVLPNTHRNLQNIRTLAAKIKAMGGESCLTELRFLDEEDELQLIAAFKRQSSDEFRELLLNIARFYEGVSVGDPRKEQLAIRRRYAKAPGTGLFRRGGGAGPGGGHQRTDRRCQAGLPGSHPMAASVPAGIQIKTSAQNPSLLPVMEKAFLLE